MLKALWTLAAGTALLAAGVPLLAHHSFAAEYDEEKPVTISGSISRVDWSNPHVILEVAVTTTDGTTEKWRIEAGAPTQLKGTYVSREMLQFGTKVVITGYAAKNGRKAAWGRDVTFTDGLSFMLVTPRDDPRDPDFPSRRPGVPIPLTFAQKVDASLPYAVYGVPGLVLAIGLWKLRRQRKK